MARNNQVESDGMWAVWLLMIAVPVVFGWMCWHRWHGTISYWGLKWAWYQLGVFDWSFMPDQIRQWRYEAAQLAMNPRK